MSLGLKSLLLIAAVMVASALAQISILGQVAMPGLLTAEREAAVDRLKRAKAVAQSGERELSEFARDWAAWQETAAYLAEPSADYPFADLVSGTLLAEDVDLFGLYDAEGALVWGALPEQRLASFSVDADALEGFLTEAMARLPRGEERASGIASVSGRAAYYTVKPIIYELYGAGVVGYLAMLRFIDGTEIARWEHLVGGVLNVVPHDDTAAPDQPNEPNKPDEQAAAGEHFRTALRDAAGEPTFWLEISVNDDAFVEARTRLGRSMTYGLLVAAATFFALLFAMQGIVLRPISRLARDLLRILPEENSYTAKRLAVRSRDEVGLIATEVNSLLARLEAAMTDKTDEMAEPARKP